MPTESHGPLTLVGILILGVIVVGKLSQCGSNPQPSVSPQAQSQPTATEKAAASAQAMKDTAQVVCRVAIKHRLKAPDSADFQNYNYDLVKEVREGTFYVETKADAVNSFNAKLRATFGCAVQCIGENDCTVKEVQEF